MPRYFLRLAYNGSGYSGWQIQNNAITVQEELNQKLSVLLRTEIETVGCGRTDAGVHASQFYVHFDYSEIISDSNAFLYSLNSLLSINIAVYELIEVNVNAHARFDAVGRSYKYYISQIKSPYINEFSLFSNGIYDLKKMNDACSLLIGKQDFTSFSKSNTQVYTNNCVIRDANWEEKEHILIFSISADRFLRGMVRAIVGTMLEIGLAKIEVSDLKTIIESKNRSLAGTSVAASGLFLTSVSYPFITPVESLNFPIR